MNDGQRIAFLTDLVKEREERIRELNQTIARMSDNAERIEQLETVIRKILEADERGQGTPFAEAMKEAADLIK